MAKDSGLGQALYVGGYDLSGDTNSWDGSSPRGVVDGTGIGSSAMERILTHGDGQINWVSFFDDAAGASHVALSSLPTANVGIALLTDNSTVGEPAFMLVAKQIGYDGTRNTDGSFTFQVNAQAAGGDPLEDGITLSAGEDTHASATSSASVDNGAGTSNGLIAMLQLREIDSGTPTFVIEESSDDGAGDAFTTVLSFTAVADGSEPTSERVEVTGTIERYLRVTSTGTFTNADHVVVARRGLAEDDVDRS